MPFITLVVTEEVSKSRRVSGHHHWGGKGHRIEKKKRSKDIDAEKLLISTLTRITFTLP